MPDFADLFRLSPERNVNIETFGGMVPVVIVDGF